MMKILKKKCPKCGKEISSMYKEQLEYNFNAHLLSCNREEEVNKSEDTRKVYRDF